MSAGNSQNMRKTFLNLKKGWFDKLQMGNLEL